MDADEIILLKQEVETLKNYNRILALQLELLQRKLDNSSVSYFIPQFDKAGG